MGVAIDSSIIIYLFENNPHYADSVEELFRTAQKERKHLILSVIAITEILTGVKRRGDNLLLRKYIAFFQDFPPLILVNVNFTIADRAADLRALYGIRTPDAIHLATAIEENASCFISNDKRLKRIRDIKVISLEQWRRYM